jgi:transcription elongation factor SPT5
MAQRGGPNDRFGNRGRGRGRGNDGFVPPMPRGRGRGRRDPLIDKTVTIIGGPYKGYIGIVKECLDSGVARVELHTDFKIINVDRTKLQYKEYVAPESLVVWVVTLLL